MELNEKLQDSATKILTWVEAGVEKGGDFVAEQTPLVAQEYITLMRFQSMFYCLLSVLALLCFATIIYKILRWYSANNGPEDRNGEPVVFSVFVCGIAQALFVAAFCSNFPTCLKAWVAPRVLLLEKLSDLLSQGGG